MNKNTIFSVAPMMNYTDRHNRFFLRLIAPHIRLYTEMITTQSILHGNVDRLLAFHPDEKYLALQLGGSQPKELAYCAKIGEDYGYDEINLNVGCPSSRVSSGRFGACLMLEPKLVAECVSTMKAKVDLPVTVKCRIGVDKQDAYSNLFHFIETVAKAGCQHFIIHARKAWLKGLSPRENRDIPPLQYELVRQIKHDFPHLIIILNGGIKSITDIESELPFVDGIMIGRAAYKNPYFLAEIEAKFISFVKDQINLPSRTQIIQSYLPYVSSQLKNKVKLTAMTRHLFGLFQGQKGAARWRRYLSEHAHYPHSGSEIINQALSLIS